jgi:hypothetical protein
MSSPGREPSGKRRQSEQLVKNQLASEDEDEAGEVMCNSNRAVICWPLCYSLMPTMPRARAANALPSDPMSQGSADPGTWKPSEPISGRRKVHVRRQTGGTGGGDTAAAAGASAVPSAAHGSTNPFAGISLTAPAGDSNPFAGVSLLAPTPPVRYTALTRCIPSSPPLP